MPVKWHPMAEKCDGTESLPVHLSRLHHPLAYKMMCKQSKAMIKVRGKVTAWKSETKFNKINNNITVQSVHWRSRALEIKSSQPE